MAKLIKTIKGDILLDREYWELDNGFKVVSSENKGQCSFSISGTKNGKNVELISKYLEAKNINHKLTSTIDSYIIEVQSSDKEKAMKFIEEWRW